MIIIFDLPFDGGGCLDIVSIILVQILSSGIVLLYSSYTSRILSKIVSIPIFVTLEVKIIGDPFKNFNLSIVTLDISSCVNDNSSLRSHLFAITIHPFPASFIIPAICES